MLNAELTELVLHSTRLAHRHCTLGRGRIGTVWSTSLLCVHGGARHARHSAQTPPLPPRPRPPHGVLVPACATSLCSAPSGQALNHRQQVHTSTSCYVSSRVINFDLRKRNELVIKIVISFHSVIMLL